jgi:hypothetical protein
MGNNHPPHARTTTAVVRSKSGRDSITIELPERAWGEVSHAVALALEGPTSEEYPALNEVLEALDNSKR